MKHYIIYFGIFSASALTMLGTRHLDDYSNHYEACAKQWQTSVHLARGESMMTNHLLEKLAETPFMANGKNCPKLLPEHAEIIRQRLELNNAPILRGTNR